MPLDNIVLRPMTVADVSTIRQLAHDIWWPTYKSYLAHDQISLMLELIYSENALREQLAAGQCFLVASRGDTAVGFVGFQPKPGNVKTMRIEKLYIKQSEQGKGVGKLLINHVSQRALAAGCLYLELNVNRDNAAVKFYGRQGFVVIDIVDIPYHGYILNDYVMRKELGGDR